jgi:hypothetical protein
MQCNRAHATENFKESMRKKPWLRIAQSKAEFHQGGKNCSCGSTSGRNIPNLVFPSQQISQIAPLVQTSIFN